MALFLRFVQIVGYTVVIFIFLSWLTYFGEDTVTKSERAADVAYGAILAIVLIVGWMLGR